ncbi:TIGR03032 family protein [Roseofilum sp. BLCC_M91]|uniref:TIGR03032 family protein n=1 Tax=Roseofilum halophilum BLCC-M91 TaxID=3022259 RepID=A0ABT7BH64_9CYAN|nr:TIGR03032 family protein [Roseofilum halophilum]MDJ1177831.1 TIGR03032 family protein [Roseofilum halophilum BLCC-M91]
MTFDPQLASPAKTAIACDADPGFIEWLSVANHSLILSTYQAGSVAVIGWNGQQINLLLRQFDKPMGLAVSGDRLAIATRHQAIVCANAPTLATDYLENQPGRYDSLYLPRVSYWTGDLNIHDLSFGQQEDIWIVNTRFSCLATLSHDFSFIPRWQPPFITELAPEDRCHLNGLAMVNGKPKYVTALGKSNTVGGWRSNKATGGIILDVETNEIILDRLSMPHSPRWYQGYLWMLNSGTGELWRIDPKTYTYDVVCALPGFGRGLAFVGNTALVALSQIRETSIFGGLPLQTRFPSLVCGVALINVETGEAIGRLTFSSVAQELYDIQVLPGVKRPTLLNLEKPATRQAFTAPDFAYWLRPSSEIRDSSDPG